MPLKLLYFSIILEYVGLANWIPAIGAAKINVIVPILTFLISLFLKDSRNTHADLWKHFNTRWLLFIMLLVLLSWMVNSAPDANGLFRGMIGYFFLYYAIIRIADTREKLQGVIFVLAASHIASIVLNPDLILHPETRSYLKSAPFLGDGNDFGLSVVTVFPLIMYLFLTAKKRMSRMLYLAMTIALVLAVIGTQSRGASLGVGATLLVLWLTSQKKVLGFLALGVLMVTALLFAAPQYFERMGTLSHYQTEGSAKGRLDAWATGIRMAKMKPVFGVGPGNFGRYNDNRTAHSIYFLALGELGLPGAFAVIYFVVGNFRHVRRNIRNCRTQDDDLGYGKFFIHLFCSMLGFAVSGAFLSCLYYPHIFIVGGLIVAAHCIYTNDLEEHKSKLQPDADTDAQENTQYRGWRGNPMY